MEIKLIPLKKFRCYERTYTVLYQQLIEFYKKELYEKASKLHFTLKILPKINEWVELEIVDGHNKKNKIQILDRKTNIILCSCKNFIENELSFCIHLAAFQNIFINGYQYDDDMYQTDTEFTKLRKNWTKELQIQLYKTPITLALYKTPISFYDSLQGLFFSYGKSTLLDASDRNSLVSKITKKEIDETIKLQSPSNIIVPINFDKLLIGIKLYEYQKDILQKMLIAKRAICSMAMGSGRALTIGAFSQLKETNPTISMLVVCPKALKLQWGSEIERVFPKDGVKIYQIIKENDIEEFFAEKQAKVAIVTYQYMNRHYEKFAKHKIVDVLVADEIQFVRNNETKTWKSLSKLQSTYFFGLSGTVIENRIEDLYNIMEIIKPGFLGPKWKFDYNYQIISSITRTKILYSGIKNINQLKQQLQSYVFSYDKIDLPPITHQTIYVKLDNNCRIKHDNYSFEAEKLISKSLNTQLNFYEKAMLQAFLLKARQCCNTYELISKEQPEISDPLPAKVNEFSKIIKEICIDKEEKLVVFSEWTQMLDILVREANAQNIEYVLYTGEIASVKKRQSLLKKFQTDPNCKIFFSSDAGGVGLDGLQLVCNNILHFELPWNPARLDQRTGRIHRLLQKNPVKVFYLIAENSIEQKIESLLTKKRDIRIQTLFEKISNEQPKKENSLENSLIQLKETIQKKNLGIKFKL